MNYEPMNYEVKHAMKYGDLCPYCAQALYVENDIFECGGEGEGTCSIWAGIYAFGRALNRRPKVADLDVELWIDVWLADFIGQSWIEIGWDRELHLRGVRETWNLPARKTEDS